jgi:[ribosomal protein S18]-alanine N-acetyltransferase
VTPAAPVSAAALRPMTAADIPAVLALEHDLFGAEAWSAQMLEGELRQQPASRHYLVAEDEAGVAGYAGLLAAARQADVLTLAVAAGRWGRGIGSALLTALLAEAGRRGCAEVFLEVRHDNDRAQRLYLRHGFAQVGIRRGYYQPSGADALVMRLDLAAARASGPAAPERPGRPDRHSGARWRGSPRWRGGRGSSAAVPGAAGGAGAAGSAADPGAAGTAGAAR